MGKYPESFQALVSEYNSDLKFLRKNSELHITKGVYVGNLYIQAESLQIAINWLTKAYWYAVIEKIAFYNYFPYDLKKTIQNNYLSDNAYIELRSKKIKNQLNNFCIAELFALIQKSQNEIAEALIFDLNRINKEDFGWGKDIFTDTSSLHIPKGALMGNDVATTKKKLKDFVIKQLYIIDFVNNCKIDFHKYQSWDSRLCEEDLFENKNMQLTPLLSKSQDESGNIILNFDRNTANLICAHLLSATKIKLSLPSKESNIYASFFGVDLGEQVFVDIEKASLAPSIQNNKKSLYKFASLTNKERKLELTTKG